MDRSYQVLFLEHARSRLPQRIQWAEELAELLNIGIDSAYRRIRGETALTFNEAVVVSHKYDISLDYLFKEGNERVGALLSQAGNDPRVLPAWGRLPASAQVTQRRPQTLGALRISAGLWGDGGEQVPVGAAGVEQ